MADSLANRTLAELARLVGDAAAVQLSVRYGGRRLYIPLNADRAGELATLLEPAALRRLVAQLGGTTVEMPLERGKRERIIKLSAEGQSTSTIAATLGCTERHVRYVRAEYRANGGTLPSIEPSIDRHQTDLFTTSSFPSSPSSTTEPE